MLIALTHKTQYDYDRCVTQSQHIIRLRPAPHCHVDISAYSLKIFPEKHFINWQQDPMGNFVAYITFMQPTKKFCIDVDLIADIKPINPFNFFIEDGYKTIPFSYQPPHKEALTPYTEFSICSEIQQWIQDNPINSDNSIDYLVNINNQLYKTINYQLRIEPGIQTPDYTLLTKTGSCRDIAWLLCIILRHLGFAARFTSGYLIQLTSEENAQKIPVDTLDLHAWTEVFLPGAGWIGLDPTSGLLASNDHIPLCATPAPEGAAPISGSIDMCKAKMSYSMTIKRLDSSKKDKNQPYSVEEWYQINQLGNTIDKDLQENDAKLTMGGEPTFVHHNHRNKKEWQIDALGKEKLSKSKSLLHDLKESVAPNGLVIKTQGKWYPGESVPRWALCCFWRKDNEPLWDNQELLMEKNLPKNKTYLLKNFLLEVSKTLGLSGDTVSAVYEDIPYKLWESDKDTVPADIDDEKTKEETQQALINQFFKENIKEPAGYVLPIHWDDENDCWISNFWCSKNNYLMLTPGESALGYRLPLESLSKKAKSCIKTLPEKSLFTNQKALLSRKALMKKISQRKKCLAKTITKHFIRTALCIEIRNNKLHVFMPYITDLDAYLELLIVIEHIAQKHDVSLIIEGYKPPQDNRMQCFSITPDPGVLEVNVHPANNWQELVNIHENLYQLAKKNTLSAEKYLKDGRTIGSGGGCHITLGGPIPKDSPFLRRPDVLQSMITFWQHHPALSYLFSSLFIGATSQAPRIDEARHDSLYELEIAFAQMPKGETHQYWLVDRLLRHLLVDVTGNTHRAEFCIDKLFSPESDFGRQGIVELRSFEMQPHAHMNLLQCLLVRALFSSFWKKPYHHRLIRWNTELSDRFMLPHFIWRDLLDILAFLDNNGYQFQADWFKPIFNFRFPSYGKLKVDDIQLTLNMALEPWPVLGEETHTGLTSRLVDSALERLQIKVTGLIQDKYIVTCNGYKLPLHATGVKGEFIAGVRFKAWELNNTLHPNLPANRSLVFDIIDIHHQRSIGGCQYFVAHPGGRNYDDYPINESEAKARLLARFHAHGHTPGVAAVKQPLENPEYPYTLDLRMQPSVKKEGTKTAEPKTKQNENDFTYSLL